MLLTYELKSNIYSRKTFFILYDIMRDNILTYRYPFFYAY